MVTSIAGKGKLKIVGVVPSGCRSDIRQIAVTDMQCQVIPDEDLFILSPGTVIEFFGKRHAVVTFDAPSRSYAIRKEGDAGLTYHMTETQIRYMQDVKIISRGP